jgi:superfamily I DNA/RNA helicase/RecB family exonuclease
MLQRVNSAVLPVTKVTPDERQREAIEHVHGPMLVIAGAGTGKTTVLTQRIAHLIREGHAQPGEVLALTYTDNAAEEMKKRVRAELEGRTSDSLQAGTFHAWCNGLLHRRGAGFGVLDDKDLWVYLRRRMRDLRLKHFVRAANVSQLLDDLLDFMRRCQDELVGPEQYAAYVDRLERGEASLQRVAKSKKQDELDQAEVLGRCRELASVYAFVERMLAEKNLGTFGHMITRAYRLLKDDAALLDEERGRTKFILVDEFQDANFAQVEILSLLAGSSGNVFAVGDPDQAIYRFRGASSAAFTLFRRHFPETRLVALDKNRRSLSPILRCAFGIVNENPPVFADAGGAIRYRRAPLASQREVEAGERGEAINAPAVEIITWADKEVEAFDLADRIRRKRKEQRCAWSDFAVLYRQHSHREELVREFMQRSIPFSIEGLDVLRTPEVRDVVACLTAAVSPADAAALFRVAALPQFAVDAKELRAAMRAVRRDELDFRKILQDLGNGPAVLAAVDEVHVEIEKEGVGAAEAVRCVVGHFALRPGPAVATFQKFVETWQTRPIAEVGSAAEFLDYLEYFVQAKGASIPLPPATEDAVRLMTAHAAKGLEFRHVAIVRGSSTSFPCAWREPLVDLPRELRTTTSAETDKAVNEQEERRLFYVAMTRAKDTLSIYAKQGMGNNQLPTKFLREVMSNSSYRAFWRTRPAVPVQDDLFGEQDKVILEHSSVASWLLMPPAEGFVASLSASAIDIYEKCPLRFKLEREWNLPREVPAALHYGKIMHDMLRTFYDGKNLGRDLSAQELIAIFEDGMAAAGIAERYQYDLYLRQGREQIAQFWELSRTTPQPDVEETEHNFELRVGTARLRGRIDRIDRAGDGRVVIVDYKTGKPKSQEDADESLQLSLYALAMRELRGQRAAQLVFYNLENNTAIATTRLDAELDAVKVHVQEVADNIAEGVFPAKPGYQCTFCPYRNLCPETEKMIAVPPTQPRAN